MGEQGRKCGSLRLSAMKVNILRAACCYVVPYEGSLRLQIRGRQRGPHCWRRRRGRRRRVGDKCQQAARTSSPQWDDNHGDKAEWFLHPVLWWRMTLGHESWWLSHQQWQFVFICVCWWRVMEQVFRSFTFLFIRNKTTDKYSITS